MGRIVVIKDFARAIREDSNAKITDVKVDHGGNNIITGEHYSNPGDDSYPMLTDYAIAVETLRTGSVAIVGYADIKNTPKTALGEKRIYSRDANGDSIGEVWIKADGEILISNSNGSFVVKADGSISGSNSSGNFELKTGGTFDINGVTIDASGNVAIPGNLTVGPLSKDFLTHIHVGSPTAPLGAISPTGLII